MVDFWVGVLGNVVASGIVAAPAWVWAHVHVKRLHRRIDGLHDHLDEQTDELVGAPAGPVETGRHGLTETFPTVEGGDPM